MGAIEDEHLDCAMDAVSSKSSGSPLRDFVALTLQLHVTHVSFGSVN